MHTRADGVARAHVEVETELATNLLGRVENASVGGHRDASDSDAERAIGTMGGDVQLGRHIMAIHRGVKTLSLKGGQ